MDQSLEAKWRSANSDLAPTIERQGHLRDVTLAWLKRAASAVYDDVIRHHTFQVAAALSYYFVLAIFPGLIFLSALMGTVSLPHLFGHVMNLMTRLLPAETMRLMQPVLISALSPKRTAWIPVSLIAVLWITSAAFDALIEALDIAYDAADPRPFWKTRLLAMGW